MNIKVMKQLTGDFSFSYLDVYFYIDNEKLTTTNVPIVTFPFPGSHIPSASPYVYLFVLKLIRYVRDCSEYQDFIKRGRLFTTRLLTQKYQRIKLMFTLQTSDKKL